MAKSTLERAQTLASRLEEIQLYARRFANAEGESCRNNEMQWLLSAAYFYFQEIDRIKESGRPSKSSRKKGGKS